VLARFWRYYAEQRQEDYFTRFFGDRILALTRRFIPVGAKVCDFGCGAGFLLEKLVVRYEAAGCDYTPANVDVARKRLAGNTNLLGVYALDDPLLPKERFDVLYLVETVEHLLDRHVDDTAHRLHALLKPGGILIATTPNEEDLQAATVFCPCCGHTFHRWQHVRSFSMQSLAEFMGRAGFSIVETFTTDFAARSVAQKIKSKLRPVVGRKNPHLVFVGREPG